MPSETDCLNDALSQIGAAEITGIDDGSLNANRCKTFYPTLRDGMIRAFKWNFSLVRVALAQDVTPPPYGFAFAYTLPADCLRIWEYIGANPSSGTILPVASTVIPQYKVEGRKIYSNDGQVSIQYGARVTNPDLWDALFYQFVATMLASKLASAITKDEKKAQLKMQEAMNVLLPMALAADGQEGSVEPFVVDDLLWGRMSA